MGETLIIVQIKKIMSCQLNDKVLSLPEVNEIKKLFSQKLYFDTWLKMKQLITNLTTNKEDLLNCLVDIILPIKIADFKKLTSTDSASKFLQKNLEFLKTLKNNSFKSKKDLNKQ